MKTIAEKDLIYKINDIAFKTYIFKTRSLEISILTNPKVNIFETLSKYKCIIKQL